MTEDKNAAPAQRTHVSSEDRSMGSHGRFHWNELMTHDVERAKRFYAETIGWDFEPTPIPEGTYWVAKRDGEPVGGIFAMRGPHFATMPEHWVSYLAVNDVDARFKTALAAGARAIRPPFDVAGFGRLALLHEPGGAMVSWMTPSS
jgi:uncharacterized protein